jgi:hypothetical protein
MDLLTTYTQNSELKAITAPPLISTVHKSPQHPTKPFPACCVFTSHSLTTASNSGNPSRTQVLSSQPPMQNSTELIAPTVLVITYRHGPHRKQPVSNSNSMVACVFVAEKTFLPSRCPETVVILQSSCYRPQYIHTAAPNSTKLGSTETTPPPPLG